MAMEIQWPGGVGDSIGSSDQNRAISLLLVGQGAS